MTAAEARAVRFDRYGGRDVLYVADIEMPSPGPGEVVVDIAAASLHGGKHLSEGVGAAPLTMHAHEIHRGRN